MVRLSLRHRPLFSALGRVDKVGQPFTDRGEVEEAGEGERGFVVARGDTAELLEVAEHSLDAVVILVAAKVAGNGLTAIRLRRDDWQDALYQQVLANEVAIIALVGEQGLGFDDRDRHQGIDSAIIGCLHASQDEAERASLIVAAGVDFARKAAA